MCQVYFTKEKVDLFFGEAFKHNDLYAITSYIYIFIKFSNEKVGLNTILTSQFQTYLFPTFIIPKFLKFCN